MASTAAGFLAADLASAVAWLEEGATASLLLAIGVAGLVALPTVLLAAAGLDEAGLVTPLVIGLVRAVALEAAGFAAGDRLAPLVVVACLALGALVCWPGLVFEATSLRLGLDLLPLVAAALAAARVVFFAAAGCFTVVALGPDFFAADAAGTAFAACGLFASERGECANTSSTAMIHAETSPATSPC